MSENPEEVPAQDEGDVDPDSLVGDEVEPEHTLNVDEFEEEDDEEEGEA